MRIIRQDQLPTDGFARDFIGADHGGAAVSFIIVNAEPGGGPALHKHPYDEIIIVQEGQATATVGDEIAEVRAGDIVVIPAGQPHKFVNTGDGPLRQIDMHLSPRFITEWL